MRTLPSLTSSERYRVFRPIPLCRAVAGTGTSSVLTRAEPGAILVRGTASGLCRRLLDRVSLAGEGGPAAVLFAPPVHINA